jgi:hypothetical protein
MASLKGDDLVVFYYLSASEIWLNKRGGLSEGRRFSSIFTDLVVFYYLSVFEIINDNWKGLFL